MKHVLDEHPKNEFHEKLKSKRILTTLRCQKSKVLQDLNVMWEEAYNLRKFEQDHKIANSDYERVRSHFVR